MRSTTAFGLGGSVECLLVGSAIAGANNCTIMKIISSTSMRSIIGVRFGAARRDGMMALGDLFLTLSRHSDERRACGLRYDYRMMRVVIAVPLKGQFDLSSRSDDAAAVLS